MLEDARYRLSFPTRPEKYPDLELRFPGWPQLVCDRSGHIVCGLDAWLGLEKREKIQVLALEIHDVPGLILNYNYKSMHQDLNLYEKLYFMRRMRDLGGLDTARRLCRLDLPLDRELLDRLDRLLSPEYAILLQQEKLGWKSLSLLLDLDETDRRLLLGVFAVLNFSENHRLRVMELAREIAFREKKSLGSIWNETGLAEIPGDCLNREELVKMLYRRRYPACHDFEEKMKKLLPDRPGLREAAVRYFPFFEKRRFELRLLFEDPESLREFCVDPDEKTQVGKDSFLIYNGKRKEK